MSKVSGKIEEFVLFKKEGTRIVVNYEMVPDEGGVFATWQEVVLPINMYGEPGTTEEQQDDYLKKIREAIQKDINDQTDKKILTGFVWNDINVYLSNENQRNFSEAQRMAEANPAILPVTFKLGEDSDDEPIYHTFESVDELNGFYLSAFAYINQCLQEGWQRKDSIDWEQYKEYFPEPEEPITE